MRETILAREMFYALKTRTQDQSDADCCLTLRRRPSLYRTAEWINLINDAGITSASRKGYSPDNAACEGARPDEKRNVPPSALDRCSRTEQAIHDYIDFYNNKESRTPTRACSIAEQRILASMQ